MMTGNNHGSIEKIGGQWYVFYHRQTHLNTFSRQGCAEKITIMPDGSIPQAEMTSCGLNDGPLLAEGTYPASICCNLTDGHMIHAGQQDCPEPMPNITHEGTEHFIAGITDHVTVGYKYFAFDGETTLQITLRGQATGRLTVLLDNAVQGEITITPDAAWHTVSLPLNARGTHALYLEYQGEGSLDIMDLTFA